MTAPRPPIVRACTLCGLTEGLFYPVGDLTLHVHPYGWHWAATKPKGPE